MTREHISKDVHLDDFIVTTIKAMSQIPGKAAEVVEAITTFKKYKKGEVERAYLFEKCNTDAREYIMYKARFEK